MEKTIQAKLGWEKIHFRPASLFPVAAQEAYSTRMEGLRLASAGFREAFFTFASLLPLGLISPSSFIFLGCRID